MLLPAVRKKKKQRSGTKAPHSRKKATPLKELVLRLFVAGASPNSSAARLALEGMKAGALKGRFELEIIDVLAQPQAALAHAVHITPTLLRVAKPRAHRIVGNIRDVSAVLRLLEL